MRGTARRREGVVKIQRPEIREQIMQDTEALAELATFLDTHTEMGKRYDFAQSSPSFARACCTSWIYRDEADT